MSEKEANDYFKKLMDDTQNKIDSIDNDTAITEGPNENNQDKKKYPDFEVKIDKSEPNQKQNMSEEPKKSKIAMATLKMPDGKEVEIPLPPKVFKTGREGYYAQITAFVYDDEVYGGQIQVWKKTPKSE